VSPARPAPARSRARSGPGALQWLALFAAASVVMALTFTLGVLVGRQWSRPAGLAASDASAKKTAAGKRGGLTETEFEPPPPTDQKLTFYQTLTAPLGRGAADASQRHEERPKAAPQPEPAAAQPAQPKPEPPRPEVTVPPPPAIGPSDTLVAKTAPAPGGAAQNPAAQSQDDAPGLWAVQAGAFKTRAQADALEKQLRQAGFDAYVTSGTAEDGQVRYRVRIGSFKSKAEAQRVADKVRADRSLGAFVAPK